MTYRITRSSLRAAGACWDDDRIAAIVPPKGIVVTSDAVREALDSGINPEDAHWVLCFASGPPDRVLREHACWCARRALKLADKPGPHSVVVAYVAAASATRAAAADAAEAAYGAATAYSAAAYTAAAYTAAQREARARACLDLAARLEHCT